MNKVYRAVAVLVAATVTSSVRADGPDISAQRLLDSWRGEDPGMKMVAEVIASWFSWGGTPREGASIAPRRISRAAR
jgi:hypothetical protein